MAQRLREAVLADFDGSEPVAEASAPALEQLSLIAIGDLELQLAAERLAASLERQHGRGLQDLALAMQRVHGQERPPLNPLALAQGLIQALGPLHVPLAGQLVILKLFERQLGTELAALLAALGAKLAEHGIQVSAQPRPKPRVIRQASSGGGQRAVASQNADAPTEPSEPEADHGWSPETVEPLDQRDRAEEAATSGSIVLLNALRDMFSGYFGSHGNGQAGSVELGSSAQPGEGLAAPAGTNRTGGRRSESGPAPLNQEQVLSALAYMQQHPPSGLFRAVDDRSAELGDFLKFELLHCARDILGLPIGGGLLQADAQGLTLVGMLFDVLLDQGDFSNGVRHQLIAISVPYTKVALLDQQMFAHRSHPARRLLNMLAEACDGNQGETRTERELLLRVEAVIKRLNKEFDRDNEIFSELEQRFSRVMSQREQRSNLLERRTAESLKGRERLEDARMLASLEVSSLMGGHQVPEPIEHFMRHDWSHHLAMVVLREGEDSEAFRNARRIGVDLMIAMHACAQGAAVPAHLAAKLKPVMQSTGGHGIDEVVEALKVLASGTPSSAAAVVIDQVGGDTAADQQAIQRRLLAMRDQRAEAAGLSPAKRTTTEPPANQEAAAAGSEQTTVELPEPALEIDATQSEAAAHADGSGNGNGFEIVEAPITVAAAGSTEHSGDLQLMIDATQVSPGGVEQVNALKPGQWVDLIDAQGTHHAAKLSWISPMSQRILFVNRGGSRLCLLSPAEAAALITQGKMKPHAADQPFDRALVDVLSRIRENAEFAHPKE